MVAVYAVPSDRAPSPTAQWQPQQLQLLNVCRDFHHRSFAGASRMSFSLHGPVQLDHDTQFYRNRGYHPELVDGYVRVLVFFFFLFFFFMFCREQLTPLMHAQWHSFKDDIIQRYLAGTLPPAVASVPLSSAEAPLAGAGAGAGAGGAGAATAPAAPTMVAFVLFVDWGREDATPEMLEQYYLVRNNVHKEDLSDIKTTGGSAATYLSEWLDCRGWAQDAMPDSRTPIPDPARGACATLVGYGCGLVSEEAWRHPNIPGSAIVTYHEGLGHALRMPHPPRRHALGVMSMGMYSGKTLADESVHLAREIVCRMVSNPAALPECCPEPAVSVPAEADDACQPDDPHEHVPVLSLPASAAPSLRVLSADTHLAWAYLADAERGCVLRCVTPGGAVLWIEGKKPAAAATGVPFDVYTKFREVACTMDADLSAGPPGALAPSTAPSPLPPVTAAAASDGAGPQAGASAEAAPDAGAGAEAAAALHSSTMHVLLFDPARKAWVWLTPGRGFFFAPASYGAFSADELAKAEHGDPSVLPPRSNSAVWAMFCTTAQWCEAPRHLTS